MEQDILKTTTVDFWNGNRSAARQVYERTVLKAILEATEEKWGAWEIEESMEKEDAGLFDGISRPEDLQILNCAIVNGICIK